MDFISKVVGLFGLTLDDPKVQAFLAEYPALKINKPSDGSQFVIGKPYGFDLLFEGERMPKTRFLTTLFLFSDKREKHVGFAGTLPFGFQWLQTHRELAAIKPSNKINLDSASWITPEFNFDAIYENKTFKLIFMIISPSKTLNITNK